MDNKVAYLSVEGNKTVFSFGETTLKFRTSEHLKKYIRVKEWDNGYIVVDCEYDTLGETEEYIDLQPMVRHLFLQDSGILSSIERVEIAYA